MILKPASIAIAALLPAMLFAQQAQPQLMPDMRSKEIIAEGIRLHDEENYEEALRYFKWVHPNDSNYSWAVSEEVNTLISLERYQEVVDVCEAALKTPIADQGTIYMALGTAYDELERSEEALTAYTRGISDSPYLAKLHFNKGITHYRLKQYNQAIACFQRTLAINPYHSGAHYVLAVMALQQGELVPATLSMSAFLMLENNTQRSLDGLSTLNTALSEKTTIEDLGVNFGDEFKKTELLVKNYAALRETYKVPSDLPLPIIKQAHLIFSQIKTEKGGWWTEFYASFFNQLTKNEDLFEGWSYLIMTPSKSESHEKIVAKNAKKIDAFANWANTNWANLHAYVQDTLHGQSVKLRYLRRDNHSVEAVGVWNENTDQAQGFYRFYDANGKLSATGTFEGETVKTGDWIYYYSNGILKERMVYTAGKANGNNKYYENDGTLAVSQDWKNDERDGLRKTYWSVGTPYSESTYKAGKVQGTYTSFYPQGQVDFKVEIVDEKTNGEGIALYPDGKKESVAFYKEGKKEGPLVRYYPNGQVKIESNYLEDLLDGPYKEYYTNGQISAKGNFIKGKRSGKWLHYYVDGAQDEIESYDESGKMTGIYQDFDVNGQLLEEIDYKNGIMIAYRFFNPQGELIREEKSKKGNFPFVGYHSNRAKAAEGEFVESQKSGIWHYYNEYQVKTSTANYINGNEDGISTIYFSDGTYLANKPYKDGQLHGLYTEYYPDSSLYCQGRYINNKSEGAWYYYNLDGSPKAALFFVDDKLNGTQKYYTNLGVLYRENRVREGLLLAYTFYGPQGEILGQGEFEQGTGTLFWNYPNGQLAYQVTVKNGQYHGKIEAFYPNGKLKQRGQYAFNEADGQWNWYTIDGVLETQGNYQAGKRDGAWKWWHEDGKLSTTSTYEADKIVGTRKDYDEEGNITSLYTYRADEFHGRQYNFGEDSTVSLIRTYRYGSLESYSYEEKDNNAVKDIALKLGSGSVKSFYANGQVAQEYTYKNGKVNGVITRYYASGKPMHNRTAENGRDMGVAKNYYTNGNVKDETNWFLDTKNGASTLYFPNGKTKRIQNFVQGDAEGQATEYDSAGKLIRNEFWFNDQLFEIK